MGITLSFARPYSPSSKGKIERFFRTLRNSFLSQLDISDISSFDELNKLNTAYIEGTYNQRPHSSLNGLSPIERFLQDKEHLRFVEASRIQRDFLHEVKRRVSKDATISLNRKIFEVPQIYCSHQVKILYSPYDLSLPDENNISFAYISPPEGGELIRIYPVRTVENSMIPRKQNLREPIDYTRLYEGE